jgi:hypothetical protein
MQFFPNEMIIFDHKWNNSWNYFHSDFRVADRCDLPSLASIAANDVFESVYSIICFPFVGSVKMTGDNLPPLCIKLRNYTDAIIPHQIFAAYLVQAFYV